MLLQSVYGEMLLTVCSVCATGTPGVYRKPLSLLCLDLFGIFQFSPCRLLSHGLVLYSRVILFVIVGTLCKSVDSRRLFYVFCCWLKELLILLIFIAWLNSIRGDLLYSRSPDIFFSQHFFQRPWAHVRDLCFATSTKRVVIDFAAKRSGWEDMSGKSGYERSSKDVALRDVVNMAVGHCKNLKEERFDTTSLTVQWHHVQATNESEAIGLHGVRLLWDIVYRQDGGEINATASNFTVLWFVPTCWDVMKNNASEAA